jgi:drug/metabolite transporter (DMT)-like permease
MFASDSFGVRASLPTLLVLIAAVLWGYGIILTRQIARMEPTLLQMLAINTVFFGAALIILAGALLVRAERWASAVLNATESRS